MGKAIHLRDQLRKHLETSSKVIQDKLDDYTAALAALPRIDFSKAQYRIKLDSLWADHGETDVCETYSGTIDHAINKAEADFKKLNKRSDIQAEYSVAIVVGHLYVDIPEPFWKKYKSK